VLSPRYFSWLAGALVGVVVLSGFVIYWGRTRIDRSTAGGGDKTFVRSWLSVVLVAGLLLFGLASFFIDDDNLRSLLMGGVIASAGTATAFYFASKAATDTQQNLLKAAFGGPTTAVLPKLAGLTVSQGRLVADALRLDLVTDPADAPDTGIIASTNPNEAAPVRAGDTVTATIKPAGDPQH